MTPRTPFHIAQPVDQVRHVMKRTGRRRLALKIEAKEGSFLIDPRRKNDKQIEKEMQGLSIDLKQRLAVWYYLSDCTLKFIRYRGLDGKGTDCYRIVHIDHPVSADDLYNQPAIVPTQEVDPASATG